MPHGLFGNWNTHQPSSAKSPWSPGRAAPDFDDLAANFVFKIRAQVPYSTRKPVVTYNHHACGAARD